MAIDTEQGLQEYPCDYMFKAFGPGNDADTFVAAVRGAIGAIVAIEKDGLQQRLSSSGKFVCVTVRTRVQEKAEMEQVYANLKQVTGLTYLL